MPINKLTNSEVFRKYRTASFIGRFSYDYRSKYFVDFNFRYDGAQYFADKWGFFPSASVGWMLTNEEFMNPLKKVLNELKFVPPGENWVTCRLPVNIMLIMSNTIFKADINIRVLR